MAGIPAAERHGEECEVREPVEPPRFSPIVDDLSLPDELAPTPEDAATSRCHFTSKGLWGRCHVRGRGCDAALVQLHRLSFPQWQDSLAHCLQPARRWQLHCAPLTS